MHTSFNGIKQPPENQMPFINAEQYFNQDLELAKLEMKVELSNTLL